jgi:H+-transporting ATPase
VAVSGSPWAGNATTVDFDAAPGLSGAEARARFDEYGANEISEQKSGALLGVLRRLWGQFPTLEAALILEAILGKTVEAAVIALLLAIGSIVGESQQRRAQTAQGYLRGRLKVTAYALRDESWQRLPPGGSGR